MTWNILWIMTSSTNSDSFPFFPTNSFSFLNCVGSYCICKPHGVLFFCSFSLWVCPWFTELIFSDLSFTKFSNVSHYFFLSFFFFVFPSLFSTIPTSCVFNCIVTVVFSHENMSWVANTWPVYVCSSTWDWKSNLRKDSFSYNLWA